MPDLIWHPGILDSLHVLCDFRSIMAGGLLVEPRDGTPSRVCSEKGVEVPRVSVMLWSVDVVQREHRPQKVFPGGYCVKAP
jgi:hypothetical protein